MMRNNNGSLSYVKVRANKNLSIQNSGSYSQGYSNYKENSSLNQNKSSSVSSRSSQENSNKNTKQMMNMNNQFSTIQEDSFNHLNRNLDFSQINLKNQQNINKVAHNSSVYSQENKENVNINYSNYLTNYQHQQGQQQETFRKINQNKDDKSQGYSQVQSKNNIQPQQQSAKSRQSNSQPKNIYQQIITANNANQGKKAKGWNTNSAQSQQRQSVDLSNRSNEGVEIQKKRSESTYSNYSFESANNQSMSGMSSSNQTGNSISLNNWLQNNQLISLDNMRPTAAAQVDSNCINISHLLNQNISQGNINVNEVANLSSISPVGVAQRQPSSKSPVSLIHQNILNHLPNQINESQNQLISRQFNSVQNSKNNPPHQIQQLNQKQFASVNNNNNFTRQNSNSKISHPQKIQIMPDSSSHQMHTFTSSENSQNNGDNVGHHHHFNISQDRLYSQSNPSASTTLENITSIQRQNEINQLKKDLRQSNNELIQYKNKLKAIEQENKQFKQQIEQDKQQKHHLEEYVQKIKGLQFIVAQEKKISSRIISENFQRNESVSLILSNLVNIISLIQSKIESPKVSYDKLLEQISENLNPILLCLNPIILDINSYNQQIIKQQQNQHESRIEPNLQMNKQVSQKGKKVLTAKGVQEQQMVQRNNSHNKLSSNHNSNQQIKKRGISVDEYSNPQKQKKQTVVTNQNQNTNSLSRSYSSNNVKSRYQQQFQQKSCYGIAEEQLDGFNQGTQHLLKQSLSSINLHTQSLNIPQIDEQNENEIEAIITKQLLNNNNNPLQQIQLKQGQREFANPIKQQANKLKSSNNVNNNNNNQSNSLNECQRINTKESVDSFYQQCLLNNSLRISESSRSINASSHNNQYMTQDNSNLNFQYNSSVNPNLINMSNLSNIQMTNNLQNDKEILSDFPLQTGSIFGQLTQCSSSLGGVNGNNGKLPQASARGQFFDSQFSQLENYSSNHNQNIKNSNQSHYNQNVQQTSQEFTGCFSTQQNQNYLVGTFSQLPIEGEIKSQNNDSNYHSGASDQYNNNHNNELMKGRRNSNGNQNNPFRMSNYNSGSSQYNQSQKLFCDTLKGLGETLRNLQQEDNITFSDRNAIQQDVQLKSKSTYRSSGEDQEPQIHQLEQIQEQLLIKQERENEVISSISDKLNQIGTEKSSTQLEIENLKKKIMQRQSRRKLQGVHNTSVQEISNSENSQRETSAPPKETFN